MLVVITCPACRHGAAVLKIMAVEQPGVFAGLVAKVLPTAFDGEYPTRITIVTGVPRFGDPSPPPGYLDRAAADSGCHSEPAYRR